MLDVVPDWCVAVNASWGRRVVFMSPKLFYAEMRILVRTTFVI